MKRQMERNKTCTCVWCGKNFDAVHYDAKSCSAKCRKAMSRHYATLKEHFEAGLAALNAIQKFQMTQVDMEAFGYLGRLKTRVDYILSYWES